jgi:hypothetical protein
LIYNVPIGIAFTAFILDRAVHAKQRGRRQWLIDGIAVGLSLLRALVAVPFLSGHALFTTYSLLSSKLGVARLLALFVLVEVAYLKITWGDLGLVGAILLASLLNLLNLYSKSRALKDAI